MVIYLGILTTVWGGGGGIVSWEGGHSDPVCQLRVVWGALVIQCIKGCVCGGGGGGISDPVYQGVCVWGGGISDPVYQGGCVCGGGGISDPVYQGVVCGGEGGH